MNTPVAGSRPQTAPPAPAVVAALRASLLSDLAAQRTQVAEHEATIRELTGQPDIDSVLEREMAETAILRASGAIVDIEHALGRIDDGTYGGCEQCGDAIPIERLEVIPHTRRCVACCGPARPLLG